jgi:hypothetical protein
VANPDPASSALSPHALGRSGIGRPAFGGAPTSIRKWLDEDIQDRCNARDLAYPGAEAAGVQGRPSGRGLASFPLRLQPQGRQRLPTDHGRRGVETVTPAPVQNPRVLLHPTGGETIIHADPENLPVRALIQRRECTGQSGVGRRQSNRGPVAKIIVKILKFCGP